MTNPIRRFKLHNPNVLPFCYELALGQQRTLSASTTAPQTDQSSSKQDNIEENPYFAKYADKIKKAQAEKLKPTTTFSQDLRGEKSKEVPIDSKEENVSKQAVATEQIKENKQEIKAKSSQEMMKKTKLSLDDIVKLDLLKEKSADEITQIWHAYHSNKDGIFATIPADVYDTQYKTLATYPAFILPLPRNKDESLGGYEFFLLQFQEHSCYFTPLAAFHLHKELAPVCLTLHHYPELSQSKGLVLMNSEYDSNLLNIMECQCLANQLQYYYTTNEAAPKLSLHLFNKEPKSFDHMRLVRHLEDGILSSGLGAINLNKQD